MKKRTLITLGITAAVTLAALYYVLPRAYYRFFPERVRAQETTMRFIFLAAAASETFQFQHVWPDSVQQLAARVDRDGGNTATFLKGGTNDSWGNPVVFEPFNSTQGYGRIISYGADGKPGGEGNSRDIVLHYGENQKMTFVKRD